MFRLFVYGSLKQGMQYHEAFCPDAQQIKPATLQGKLYHLQEGYPGLLLPEDAMLALGTADYLADEQKQESHTDCKQVEVPTQGNDAQEWGTVHGELFHFSDSVASLPRIDELEAFYPDGESEYHRVLTTVQVEGEQLTAWTYISTGAIMDGAVHLQDGIWKA